ncbi:MAG: HipA domain-containing protein [Bacteroidales bacterium]|nr:HipA domain-containing protein [Bacteroidales bacterium]
MNYKELKYCPGTLKEGFSTYSPVFLRKMFNGKKVSHILPFESPQKNEDVAALFIENRKRISFSGVQEKLSMILDKNHLRLTEKDEQGTYILKPIPRDLKKVTQVPANEHLTMQIAQQVYNINTATNGIIFFKDGTPAYITKRFDVKNDGGKWGKEDFASLAGKTIDNSGSDFKYQYSYEELGLLIQKYVPAWRVEIEKYFSVVLFNYLFSNGDAHLKNFSLLESPAGDFLLSPIYDLVNTKLHVDDTDFALDKGLFADDYQSEKYKINGHAGKTDLIEFGKRIGISKNRIENLIEPFLIKHALIETLVEHSFLETANKRGYLHNYSTKRNYLLEK